MNSKILERKTEKHEIQVLSCDGGLKADENWMSAETSWVGNVSIMSCKPETHEDFMTM